MACACAEASSVIPFYKFIPQVIITVSLPKHTSILNCNVIAVAGMTVVVVALKNTTDMLWRDEGHV
ncbi:predicted protein [Sclerotinia sclerotiorum 1980 UF-70]|uniref:Uncharacterized protein n=1 Tax=Sclerotinia sclerotiorum (strain ATCC 18683 / 1980 / Ss-1) TaxID=665079 RepID=A7EJH9_SCLS1|nr:predicted protein [Sclerotinia sclerotiorum 1980 UF-70]EDO02995.1 predicted protein [Sclerotinia sclerotiorum 1980 UF-70]